jgi:hypothetical protein
MNTSIEQSRLYGLNIDLLRNIFEFDDTTEKQHRSHFFNHVRQELWSQVWKRWLSNIDDDNIRTVMEYLMTNWGVYGEINFSEYYIYQIFPEDINWYSCVEIDSGKYHCTIFHGLRNIFTGYVLDEQQEYDEVFGDGNWTELDKIHVHTDYEIKRYVYQCTGIH